MKINDLIDKIVTTEGGYVDHPSDRGGPTKYGITEQVARAFGYKGDMRDLPVETARAIYLRRYWHDPNLDMVHALTPSVAEEMADTGVNMGPGTAIKFLQRALNHLNSQARHYPDVPVDGQLGPLTIVALKSLLLKRGVEAEVVLVRMLNAQQSVRYMEITERDAKQEDFAYGWQSQRVS